MFHPQNQKYHSTQHVELRQILHIFQYFVTKLLYLSIFLDEKVLYLRPDQEEDKSFFTDKEVFVYRNPITQSLNYTFY